MVQVWINTGDKFNIILFHLVTSDIGVDVCEKVFLLWHNPCILKFVIPSNFLQSNEQEIAKEISRRNFSL